MTVADIYSFFDGFAPFAEKAEWDNSGLIVGDINRVVTKAVVALDITEEELSLAVKSGAQLIISHHPVIFHAQKDFIKGSIAFELAANSISALCAHTNLDKAPGGVNDALCEKLGLPYDKLPDAADGFLNVIYAENGYTPAEFAALLRDKLAACVRYCCASSEIKKIGVCSGAGSEFVPAAAQLSCDAFLTGDASYHNFLDAHSMGVSLFAAGHFETENIIIEALIKKLRANFKDIEFLASPRKNPVLTVI